MAHYCTVRDSYIRAARIHLPCAVEKIAFDRFHVAKQLGEVVDKIRQNEHPHLPVESRRQAKGPASCGNSKIRLLRIKARGYRNRERFKLGVMFHYGKLNMAF